MAFYTPQQNGGAERKNRTLVESARYMSHQSNMLNTFWVEAILTSCYIQNRCAHIVLKNKTLEKVWTGYKPSLNHIKMFGCDSYVHVPFKLRIKLDNKFTKVCKLLGYSENLKGFKLYDT